MNLEAKIGGHMTFLIWFAWAAWLTLFAWLAWRKMGRFLLISGTVMIVTFVVVERRIMNEMGAAPDASGGMAGGLFLYAAAAVLLLPVAVAAVVYSIARFGPKFLDALWGVR